MGRAAQQTRVLVVDDDDSIRSILQIFLEHEGFSVIGNVADERAALDYVRSQRADVVVLDLALAGVGGLEVAPHLLEEDPGLPIVVFSGVLHPSVLARAEHVGVRECIGKHDIGRLGEALKLHARPPGVDL